MDEATVQIFVDGAEIAVDKYKFEQPRHVHRPIQPPGRPDNAWLGAPGFGISFCGPADVLRPYLDGEFHDVLIRAGASGVELAARIRLSKHDEENGTWYGRGCVTGENYQVIEWKELVNG